MKELRLTNTDKVALVDDDDYEVVKNYKWHLNKAKGYVVHFYYDDNGGHSILLHRAIYDITDHTPQVDHINHNKLDNRKCNLRGCTQSQNRKNNIIPKTNNSGYKGVAYCKYSKKNPFRCQMKINNECCHCGLFATKEKAALRYNLLAMQYYGDFACYNDLPEFNQIKDLLLAFYKEGINIDTVNGVRFSI